MRRLVLGSVATLLVAAVGLTTLAGSTAAAEKLPVPYNFLPNAAIPGGLQTDAPGTNDWSCRPSSAHPRPVVLVHGTFGNQATNWQTYGPLLKNNGYCVFALTYGTAAEVPPFSLFGGLESMVESAAELRAFVDRVLAATGAKKVDLVGHSQGTLMPNYYAKFLGGARKIGTYVSLAPLWHGTELSGIPARISSLLGYTGPIPGCVACGEFAPQSSFMAAIRAGGVAVPGIRYVNIMTRYDELVLPYTSGREVGMTNLVVQDVCPIDFSEHFQVAASKTAAHLVLNALDPDKPRPVPCGLVLPFVGLSS